MALTNAEPDGCQLLPNYTQKLSYYARLYGQYGGIYSNAVSTITYLHVQVRVQP